MRAITIGYGSIGRNRTSILRDMGVDVITIDIDEIDNLDKILESNSFDFGLVCTPSNLHLEHVSKLSSHKINFFCEKPYFSKLNNNILTAIENHVKNYNLINMVACNWRFSDRIKSIPDNTRFIKVRFGYNLAQWRNDGKHRQLYSANRSMGGGVLMDAIHELDYLYYKFGKIKKINISEHTVSYITNDTEDYVIGSIEFECGTLAIFELDYLSMVYQRYYEFLDEKDKLIKINLIDNAHIKSNVDEYAKILYHDELKYFVDCVESKAACMNNVLESRYLLEKLFSGHNKL